MIKRVIGVLPITRVSINPDRALGFVARAWEANKYKCSWVKFFADLVPKHCGKDRFFSHVPVFAGLTGSQ